MAKQTKKSTKTSSVKKTQNKKTKTKAAPVKATKKTSHKARNIILSSIVGGVLVIGLGTTALVNRDTYNSAPNLSQAQMVDDLNQIPLPQLTKKVTKKQPVVELKTTEGNITIKLFPDYAPMAVENFLTHAKAHYYDNTTFHRVAKDFMIQGGDPKGTGQGGQSIWKGKDKKKDSGTGFANEISPSLYNINGALAMANTGQDSSNGSQFFINVNHDDATKKIATKKTYPTKIYNRYKKGGNPTLDSKYTVFGQVIKGMNVAEKINKVETVKNSEGEKSKPKKTIKVKSIKIIHD